MPPHVGPCKEKNHLDLGFLTSSSLVTSCASTASSLLVFMSTAASSETKQMKINELIRTFAFVESENTKLTFQLATFGLANFDQDDYQYQQQNRKSSEKPICSCR